METQKFTTNLNKALLQAIRVRAAIEGRNINDILNELMETYLQYINSKET